MISINEFHYASFEKKCDLVTCYCNYLTMRKLGDSKIYLYHTGNFYVEVYYSTIYKKVLAINAFNDAKSLFPYIENISLEDLCL